MTTLTINDQLVELGTLKDNENTAVQRVGARMVEQFIDSFNMDYKPDVETTANVLYYLTDIQVRDYALGLLDKHEYSHVGLALEYLAFMAPTDTIYVNAPVTLLAQLHYENGDKPSAYLWLSNAQPNYTLAQLLFRVFNSGWEPEGFAKMRRELHPKVVTSIFGEEE
jgi:Domain of unknown function (DUF4192)